VIHNHGSHKNWKKLAIKLPVLYWFFHENHSLFKFFEITRIGSFLVLSFLQRIGTSGSLILKYFKSWNWWFLKNSHNRTTLIVCLFCVFEISQTTNGVYCALGILSLKSKGGILGIGRNAVAVRHDALKPRAESSRSRCNALATILVYLKGTLFVWISLLQFMRRDLTHILWEWEAPYTIHNN
jgi:hypothetical protein